MNRAIAPKAALALAAALALSACARDRDRGAELQPVTRADFGGEEIITDFTLGPPGAAPGACWGKDVTPATVEQVTEQRLIKKAKIAPNGNILAPAEYETVTEARIVGGHEQIYFETPCPPRWTPDFIASIQRALTARGLYDGPASGTLDDATRRAIRSFQMAQGLNSAILSTESARQLGLVEIDLS